MESEEHFIEAAQNDEAAYLSELLADDVTRGDLIEAMESLLRFTKGAKFKWENEYYALIYATVARSGRTFSGVCMLLRAQLPAQAAMLTRTLFEDVIVAHWLVLNQEDPEWLVERFLRHREAIALHQRHRRQETSWAMEPPLSAPEDLEDRAEALREEFGKEAQKNWWDPGRKGKGEGQPIGLRKIVRKLEQAAEERKRFYPRFAGGEEALLARIDLVIHKWLSQSIHHTAIGLPFAPTREKTVEAADPMYMVGFSAAWLFAQQVYLMFEINHMSFRQIDAAWVVCMTTFMKVSLPEEDVEEMLSRYLEHYGVDLD